MRIFLVNFVLSITCCQLLVTASAFAASEAELDSSLPIRIEANRMLSLETENSVLFSGNVDARQGDVVIRSDEMTVYYESAGSSGQEDEKSQQVKKLICKGNVQITRGDWLGTGNRMDYLSGARKVILSGDAKTWQNNNMVSGKTIIYYLDEKRSIVEADTEQNGRVQSVFRSE